MDAETMQAMVFAGYNPNDPRDRGEFADNQHQEHDPRLVTTDYEEAP